MGQPVERFALPSLEHDTNNLANWCTLVLDYAQSHSSHKEAAFHTFGHSLAFYLSILDCFEALEEEDWDPLGIQDQIKLYNQQNQTHIETKDFFRAMTIVAWTHDLGDVGKLEYTMGDEKFILHTDRNGQTTYKSEGAEQRSIRAVKWLLKESKETPEVKELVTHLIAQTTKDLPADWESVPFSRVVRMLDQVSQAHKRPDRINSILGLLQEILDQTKNLQTASQNPNLLKSPVMPNPELFLDYPKIIAEALYPELSPEDIYKLHGPLPEQDRIEQAREIIDQNPHQEWTLTNLIGLFQNLPKEKVLL